ncbi:hypothetical protein GCM10011341_38020 [Frigidibacter albus]|nr:hypothetical protein GCM10011341_38020 [Frigidibacter albus]
MNSQELEALAAQIIADRGHPATYVSPPRPDQTRTTINGKVLTAQQYMTLLLMLVRGAQDQPRQLTPAAARSIREADESCEPRRRRRR